MKARLGACRANDPCGDGSQQVLGQHLKAQTCAVVVGVRWQHGCLGEGQAQEGSLQRVEAPLRVELPGQGATPDTERPGVELIFESVVPIRGQEQHARLRLWLWLWLWLR